MRENVLSFQHAQWVSRDIGNLGATDRATYVGEEVQSYLRRWVYQLDKEFVVASMWQMVMRDQEIGCYRGLNHVRISGHEIDVVCRHFVPATVPQPVDVQTDRDTAGEGDPLGIEMTEKPSETVVKRF